MRYMFLCLALLLVVPLGHGVDAERTELADELRKSIADIDDIEYRINTQLHSLNKHLPITLTDRIISDRTVAMDWRMRLADDAHPNDVSGARALLDRTKQFRMRLESAYNQVNALVTLSGRFARCQNIPAFAESFGLKQTWLDHLLACAENPNQEVGQEPWGVRRENLDESLVIADMRLRSCLET